MPERANVGSRTPAGLAEYALRSLSFGGDADVPSRPPPGFARLEPENEDITPLLIEAAKRGLLGGSIATGLAGASGIRTLSPLVEDAALAKTQADAWRAGIREGSLLPSASTIDPYSYGPPSAEWADRAAYRKRVDDVFPDRPFNEKYLKDIRAQRYLTGGKWGASMPHSPVDPRWSPQWNYGYYNPDADQTIRQVLYDETIGSQRRRQSIKNAEAVAAKARAAIARQGATKALVGRAALGAAKDFGITAALGAAVGPASAYAGHKYGGAPTSGGFIRKPEGYEGALSSSEMNAFIDAQQAEKEELRLEYVDEVNSRFGPGTVSQDARIEELRDYLGPIR